MTREDSPNLAQELRFLERKRQALLRVVRLTASLEKLRQGYEAMLHLGQKDHPLPINAVKLFEQLGRKVRNLSDTDIKLRLNGLDKLVLKSQLQVSNAVAELTDPKCSDLQLETVSQQIRDFQRLAHTDIALRVLVERRRIEIPPLKLSLPIDELKTKISEVTHQERHCRVKVSERINAMRVDLQRIIHSGLCSEAQKSLLGAMDDALKENIAHINAGKSIEDLPTPVEDFELETVANYQIEPASPLPQPIVEEPSATSATHATIPQKSQSRMEESQTANSGKPSGTSTRQTTTETSELASKPKAAAKPARTGLVERFKIWLSTPWEVSWKDTDKDKKQHGSTSSENRKKQK